MTQKQILRRDFLKTSALAVGARAFPASSYAAIPGANHRINFAIIDCGGMGTGISAAW